jgi:transcription antitermination factor NusG
LDKWKISQIEVGTIRIYFYFCKYSTKVNSISSKEKNKLRTNLEYNWYAAYTKSRNEKKVLLLLQKENIEVYLPLQKKLKHWSDRNKWVEVPLFNSYIFVKISQKEYYDVLKTPGIVKFISFEGKAVAIPENQITALQKIVDSQIDFEITKQTFKKGDKIRIDSGSFVGIFGELIEVRENKKFLIRIEPIGYSVLINMNLVKKVSE